MTEPGAQQQPQAFDFLAEGVQRQLHTMRWDALRPIQADAIRAYFASQRHLLIMAETAGGKTEAAFLPVLSDVCDEPKGSVRALYIGPLKALINDQFGRLEELCSYLDVAVHRWHGDVSASAKAALVRDPSGVLLITPESLESLLVNRTSHLGSMFSGLRAIVIDEVHAFLEGERGLHLASLLHRIRRYVHADSRPPRMLGLSATVGDPEVARRYLSPGSPQDVDTIEDQAGGKEIQFRIHGYPRATEGGADASSPEESQMEPDLAVLHEIASDLVEHCHGRTNLVFANAKGDIEICADMANEACTQTGRPEAFLVHHGSLSREVREDAEAAMKSGRALTTICSSTLEMGIDIGSVWMVGQIGAPWSVASFKQRLGRSGRRDSEPRRLRGYVNCDGDDVDKDPLACLPLELLQTVAICELMLKRWVEPPRPASLDLSTLTHQIISTIAELGAVEPAALHTRLCCEGPFRAFSPALLARLLRELGAQDVIEQGRDGALILGLVGEQLRNRKDFYAAFATRVEYSVIAGDRVLGTLPFDTVPKPGEHIVFAARRWQVASVDAMSLTILVTPAKRRQRPKFTGGVGEVHPRVREEMSLLLQSEGELRYLDIVAAKALGAARVSSVQRGLAKRGLIKVGQDRTAWLTWTGTRAQRTLIAMLSASGVDARDRTIAIECRIPAADLQALLVAAEKHLSALEYLAEQVYPKQERKYDYLLSDDLLEESIAIDRLDPSTARQVLTDTLAAQA